MNQVFKYKFYIGWNNKTHKREIQKAIKVLNNFKVLGFNINKDVLGFWENQKENSFIIEIISTQENQFNDNKARDIKKVLEEKLKQFLVLTTKEELIII